MITIKDIRARQIVDCKCRPMVEVDVLTNSGIMGRGSAPTGTSVGKYEAFVLRDNNPQTYNGLSVHKAVENVHTILKPALVGMPIDTLYDLKAIDRRMIELDGTEFKENIGGNALYSTSIACMRAAAAVRNIPVYHYLGEQAPQSVPVPSFNVINGGKNGAIMQAFNEFLLMPYKAENIYEAVEIAIKCFQKLESILHKFSGAAPVIGKSFGWTAPSNDPAVVLELMAEAVKACGYEHKVAFALDCASSEMYDAVTQSYELKGERVSATELIAYTKSLTAQFPLFFIEDLLDENDWENYPKATAALQNTLIIGDDIIVSNLERIKKAHASKAMEGFILKPNQVGTLSEALDTHTFARQHNMLSIPSGRSGGVIDDIIMDLAIGLEVGFIKNGAPRSGERIEKLNFLMRACDLNKGCHLADITPLVKFSTSL